MLIRAVAITTVLAGLLAALLFSQFRREPLHVSGFIEADEIRLGSRVGGRVAMVHVEEGTRVFPGDTLVELEPFDLLEERAQAEAQLAQRRAAYEKLSAGFRAEEVAQAKARYDELAANLEKLRNGPRKQEIAAAQARLDLANAELELADTNFRRVESLVERNAATREEMDRATEQLRVTRAALRVRDEELGQLLEGTRPEEIAEAEARLNQAGAQWKLFQAGYRAEEIAEAEAAMNAAQSALAVIERQVAELAIRAPGEGIVEAVELQPGDLTAGSAPVISVMDTSRLWVRAYVPENRLSVQTGQKVTVTVDSFPGEKFAAHLSFVAREAEFTPGNVQTPEERSKQVFRIKATLDEGLDRLRPGMAADVWLETENLR
jgi:multidrug resistance efflux pump